MTYHLRNRHIQIEVIPATPPASSRPTTEMATSDPDSMEQLQASMTELLGKISTIQAQVRQPTPPRPSPQLPGNLIAPEKFAGRDTEDISSWLEHFDDYATFQGWDAGKKLQALPLMLTGRARTHFKAITPAPTTWNAACDCLRRKYGPGTRGFLEETSTMDRCMAAHENVTEYAEEMLKRLNRAGVEEPQKWRYFVRGLPPSIRAYVLDKDPTSFDQAEQFARKAEQLAAVRGDSDMDKLVSLALSIEKGRDNDHTTKLDRVVAAVERREKTTTSTIKGKPPFISDKGRHQSQSRNIECWYCGKLGHMKVQCRKRQRDSQQHSRQAYPTNTNRHDNYPPYSQHPAAFQQFQWTPQGN